MQAFRFHHEILGADDPRLAAALAANHGAKLRPLCMCQRDGVPMYVARSGDHYLIKRMPNTGNQHGADCDSYEPPAELSGLGEVSGSAIQEDIESGLTALKLDFSLSKTGTRKAPVASGIEPESVRTDGAKLTLRGALHYLWDEAGLSRWSPAMAGKRSWFVVRKHLLQAAENKTTKGAALGSLLFVPETFSVDHKDELLQRRTARLAALSAPADGARKLMVLVGEVKLIEPSRYGHKLVVKHLPDMPFMMAEDLYKRLLKRFGNDLALWDAAESTHLVAVATFGLGPTGIASIEEMALVVASANWIPIEHVHDLQLIDALTQAGRRFTKGLRYNLAGDQPLASAVLSDTVPRPVALYIVPPNATDDHKTALDALVEESDLAPWIWRAGEQADPPLPARVDYEPAFHPRPRDVPTGSPHPAPERKHVHP
jgi:hypothetical protein